MSHGRKAACRKGCCFTPFDVCARKGNCGWDESDMSFNAHLLAEVDKLWTRG